MYHPCLTYVNHTKGNVDHTKGHSLTSNHTPNMLSYYFAGFRTQLERWTSTRWCIGTWRTMLVTIC